MGAFGRPFEQPTLRSIVSTLVVDPTLGFDVSRPAQNLQVGATPNSDNFIMREGRLEPRPMLSAITDGVGGTSPELPGVNTRAVGGLEVVSVDGLRYLMLANDKGDLVWLQGSTGTWASRAAGTSSPGNLAADDFWDWTQVYYEAADENVAVGVPTSRSGMFIWEAGSTLFSKLTGAPGAKCLAVYDHYILAGNVEADGEVYPQRIMWCDRGSISSWTGGLSGFDELLGAKGGINRIMPLENRVAVFFDDETWVGAPVDFPSTFRFIPLDPTVGTPYPWTVANTPRGPIFMARNFQLYLLPKEGGPPQPIGQPIHRSIRSNIVQAGRAFGLYDGIRNMYQLYYSSGGSGNLPRNALWLDLNTGVWAPQSFSSSTAAGEDHALQWGFVANLSNASVPSWDAVTATWDNMNVAWNDLDGTGNERQTVVLVASHGTVYRLDDSVTSDFGRPVLSYWEPGKLGAEWPGQQKTITRVQADYAAGSNSTVSVRPYINGSLSTGTRMALPASGGSQGDSYHYAPSRYASVRFESEGQRDLALERFFITMRVGGR